MKVMIIRRSMSLSYNWYDDNIIKMANIVIPIKCNLFSFFLVCYDIFQSHKNWWELKIGKVCLIASSSSYLQYYCFFSILLFFTTRINHLRFFLFPYNRQKVHAIVRECRPDRAYLYTTMPVCSAAPDIDIRVGSNSNPNITNFILVRTGLWWNFELADSPISKTQP